MKNLNRVTIIGQLTADPELKVVSSGRQMSTFRIATNYSWKDANDEWKSGVDYHRVVAWGKLAERTVQFNKKGERVFLEGKLRTRSWEDEEGNKKWGTEIIAHSIVPMTSTAAQKKVEEFADVAGNEDELSPETAATYERAEEVLA